MSSMRRVVASVAMAAVALIGPAVAADHQVADCPLSLVGEAAGPSDFFESPHGIFMNGSVVYVLRGQVLTTFNMTDTGELSIAREDRLHNLAALGEGSTAYSNGYLFISSPEGLEIYDLRETQGGAGGQAPSRISRTMLPHYDEIAVSGNLLAGLWRADELHCIADGDDCSNSIDIYSIANLSSPTLMSSISSANSTYVGFNDIAFANGYLYATGFGGTHAFDLNNAMTPINVRNFPTKADWLATNGDNLLAIGQDTLVGVFFVGPGPDLGYFRVVTLPSIFGLANDIRFGEEAWIDDDRLITLINTVDPITLEPARTIAFDVFDFSIPIVPGFYERLYENVTFVESDEVLHDPLAAGPFVYVTGEISGTQVWGACGEIAGRIELDDATALPCGGAQIHGWVTGQNRIASIELFLDNESIGETVTLGRERTDISSRRVVRQWAAKVNLDDTPEGVHTIRAVATDVNGNTRQFASESYYFGGPGENCIERRKGFSRGR